MTNSQQPALWIKDPLAILAEGAERGVVLRDGRIVEIKSPLILQPGPAALTDGLDAIVAALWPESTATT